MTATTSSTRPKAAGRCGGDCSNACGPGQEECEAGQWRYCTAPQPIEELCDGGDNDCDGFVDEGCDCRHGERQNCGIDVGVCEPGVEHCENGVWTECQLPYDPDTLEELCNDGLDNDCDGETDEDCTCIPGDTQECGTNEGECTAGVMECLEDSSWSDECVGAVGPQTDVCDGLDNDCDGGVDWVEGIGFGWESDDQEPNETCDDAAPLYNEDGRAELAEGSDWIKIRVDDTAEVTTYPTLYGEGDEDWYYTRAIESSNACVPWTSECSYVVNTQLWLMDRDLIEGAIQDYEDWRLCIGTVSDCSEAIDSSNMLCTHSTDWDEASSSYLFSITWGGSCGSDDSRDLKIRVTSPTGLACGHYQLYVRFSYDETIECS